MRRPGFTSTAFFVWSGLLIWAAYFLFLYIFVALACARGFSDVRIAGLAIVPVVAVVGGALALLAAIAAAVRALRHLRTRDSTPTTRFIASMALALSLLASIAIVWTLLPALLTRSGC